VSIVGIPVYLHYCGGELEEVSYVLKSNGCCGDEEPMDDGCCQNEDYVVRFNPDFVFKKDIDLKTFDLATLFLVETPYLKANLPAIFNFQFSIFNFLRPPDLIQGAIIKVTSLRI
jgi:hypothetical protein